MLDSKTSHVDGPVSVDGKSGILRRALGVEAQVTLPTTHGMRHPPMPLQMKPARKLAQCKVVQPRFAAIDAPMQ